MYRRPPLLARLRRSRFAGWLAVWLMCLQIIGGAEHLSAQSALAAGVSSDGPLGFLGICTVGDAAPLAGSDLDGRGDRVTAACTLCAIAATAGHAILTAANEFPLPPFAWARDAVVAHAQTTPVSEWRYGAVRGPPLLSR